MEDMGREEEKVEMRVLQAEFVVGMVVMVGGCGGGVGGGGEDETCSCIAGYYYMYYTLCFGSGDMQVRKWGMWREPGE